MNSIQRYTSSSGEMYEHSDGEWTRFHDLMPVGWGVFNPDDFICATYTVEAEADKHVSQIHSIYGQYYVKQLFAEGK